MKGYVALVSRRGSYCLYGRLDYCKPGVGKIAEGHRLVIPNACVLRNLRCPVDAPIHAAPSREPLLRAGPVREEGQGAGDYSFM
jgi:hypothetical protein